MIPDISTVNVRKKFLVLFYFFPIPYCDFSNELLKCIPVFIRLHIL